MRDCVRAELGLKGREVLHQKRREETIFTKGEQILLVQGVDVTFGVVVDDADGDDDRSIFVGCTNPVDRETTWQTCHGTEETLESLRQVMRDIVLVNLDHRPP